MTHPSKRKGNTFEREVVDAAKAAGLESKRAWGSDGRSLGFSPEVDLVIGDAKVQAKRRRSIAEYLKPSEAVDAVVFREDRGETLVLMKFDTYLEMLSNDRSEPS